MALPQFRAHCLFDFVWLRKGPPGNNAIRSSLILVWHQALEKDISNTCHTWTSQRFLSSAQVPQLLRFRCDIGHKNTVSNKLPWCPVKVQPKTVLSFLDAHWGFLPQAIVERIWYSITLHPTTINEWYCSCFQKFTLVATQEEMTDMLVDTFIFFGLKVPDLLPWTNPKSSNHFRPSHQTSSDSTVSSSNLEAVSQSLLTRLSFPRDQEFLCSNLSLVRFFLFSCCCWMKSMKSVRKRLQCLWNSPRWSTKPSALLRGCCLVFDLGIWDKPDLGIFEAASAHRGH